MTRTLALVALSARMLAESARRGGFECVALDLFGDRDTRRAASAWSRIGDPSTLRLDAAATIAALAAIPHCAGWIAGGGTDGLLGDLEANARPLPLIGNRPEVVRALRTPRTFFAALTALGIPHPETAVERPPEPHGWLSKDLHGSGGLHVRASSAHDDGPAAPGRYFQRRSAGTPMSVLFVAAGRDARIVAFNELIVEPLGTLPFVYRGAIGPVVPPARTRREVTDAVHAIVRRFDLVGVNSVDFLLDGDAASVLEVNPRPSASMALHDDRSPNGLVSAHVDASLRRALPPDIASTVSAHDVRGNCVVFAEEPVRCDDDAAAALLACGFAHDVPAEDSPIPPGAPVCTVSAHGHTASGVRAALSMRAKQVLRVLAPERCAQ